MKLRIVFSLIFVSILSAAAAEPPIDTLQTDYGFRIVVPYKPKPFRKPYPPFTDSLSRHTLTVDGLKALATMTDVETDEWGGRCDMRIERRLSGVKGYWGVGKCGDRFYFITPEGNPAVVAGVNHVRPATAMDFCSREQAYEFRSKFPSVERWAEVTGRLLADNGFNGFNVAPFFSTDFRKAVSVRAERSLENPRKGAKLGHCEQLYLLRTFLCNYAEYHGGNVFGSGQNRFLLVFDPFAEEDMCRTMEAVARLHRNNPHLIGYYIDNELPFNSWRDLDHTKGIELEAFLTAEDSFDGQFEGARAYARDFMKSRGIEPAAENITTELRDEFRYAVARRYFELTTSVIRRYDKQHLILGCRLFDSSMYNEWTVRACAEFCDVVTVNYYNHWQPQPSYIAQLAEWCGDVPFMVTEFYVKAENTHYRGHVYDQKDGGGWMVADQPSRGAYYQNFCIRLLGTGRCIGWQHFDYVDLYGHDTWGTLHRGGSNKGIVDASYEPYAEFLKYMSQLNGARYKVIDLFDLQDSPLRSE